jgi:DNA-binding PadR family transcriptional regulator
MSETRDKRRKSDLDLFVLALIRSGVSTPYALQREAGLSPGATIPAIKRMLDAGFVRQGKPGPRGRTDARITAAGKRQLRNTWRGLIDAGASGDLDADLRVAMLAISEGTDYSSAAGMLKGSAGKLLQMAEAASRDNESTATVPLAGWYRELRSVSVRALLEGQAAAATLIADSLLRKLPGTAPKTSHASSKKASSRRVKRVG